MKIFFSGLLCGTLLLTCLQPVSLAAVELEPKGTPWRKLQRGFVNMALSPIELSHELHKEKGKDEYFPTWLSGLSRGGVFTLGRALSGLYDVLTFPIPLPEGYESLIMPEFVTEHLPASAKS